MPFTTMIDQEIILEFQGGSDLYVDDPQPIKPNPGGRPHPQHVTVVNTPQQIKLKEIVLSKPIPGRKDVTLVVSMDDVDTIKLIFVPK